MKKEIRCECGFYNYEMLLGEICPMCNTKVIEIEESKIIDYKTAKSIKEYEDKFKLSYEEMIREFELDLEPESKTEKQIKIDCDVEKSKAEYLKKCLSYIDEGIAYQSIYNSRDLNKAIIDFYIEKVYENKDYKKMREHLKVLNIEVPSSNEELEVIFYNDSKKSEWYYNLSIEELIDYGDIFMDLFMKNK